MATSFDFFRVEQLRSRVRHACLVDPLPSRIVIAPRPPYLPHGPFALGGFDPRNTKVTSAHIENRLRTPPQTKKAVVDNRGLRKPGHQASELGFFLERAGAKRVPYPPSATHGNTFIQKVL
jgi:hypothetical protein